MSPLIRLASLLLTLLITCEAINVNPPTAFVKITNHLSHGMVLTIHCHSGNLDLGVHAVPHNAAYSFYYEPSLLSSTIVTCNFQWPGQSKYYDIYSYYRDQTKCGEDCEWEVSEECPCRWFPSQFGGSPYGCESWK